MSEGSDEVGRLAANNAGWCDAVARAHGGAGRFDHDAWTSPIRTPRLYPDAVTLVPGVDPERLLDRVDDSSGCSVKDSYADLDLTPFGFRILFDATWITLDPGTTAPAPVTLDWSTVASTDELRQWETAWRAGDDEPPPTFPPSLLDDPTITFLAGRRADRIVAGAITNEAAGVVGLSNVFAVGTTPTRAWAEATAAARSRSPARTIAGYEQGDDLAAAVTTAFRPVAPLRVWFLDHS